MMMLMLTITTETVMMEIRSELVCLRDDARVD